MVRLHLDLKVINITLKDNYNNDFPIVLTIKEVRSINHGFSNHQLNFHCQTIESLQFKVLDLKERNLQVKQIMYTKE